MDVALHVECADVSRPGRLCGQSRGGGAHAHCCGGAADLRSCGKTQRHNPLVQELTRILAAAGHSVATELQDTSMGPIARLDIVEFASDAGAPAAHGVSVFSPLRADSNFREACASELGLAAEQREKYYYKRAQQYS